jgi:hypothetical protein
MPEWRRTRAPVSSLYERGAAIRKSLIQFGYALREPGDAVTVQRRLGILAQMLNTLTPVSGREVLTRCVCQNAFEMNEFVVENLVMHG